jgi:hypothetical protein
MAHVAEFLPSKREAPSSNTSITTKGKKKPQFSLIVYEDCIIYYLKVSGRKYVFICNEKVWK